MTVRGRVALDIKIQNHQHLPGHQISEGPGAISSSLLGPCTEPPVLLLSLYSLLPLLTEHSPSSGSRALPSSVPGRPSKHMFMTRAVHAHTTRLSRKLFHKNDEIQTTYGFMSEADLMRHVSYHHKTKCSNHWVDHADMIFVSPFRRKRIMSYTFVLRPSS